MIIVHAGSEVVPYSKTGGLADVLGALPLALADRGNDVIIVSPLYPSVASAYKPEREELSLTIRLNGQTVPADIYSLRINDHARAYFIANDALFSRDGLYVDKSGTDYPDNAERFIFFSRAVIELLKGLAIKPDVVHAHDWQAGLVPAYMKTLEREYCRGMVSVFTIHNIGYQGSFWHFDMPLTGLGWEYFTSDYLEFYGRLSLLKAGIVFADAVTTVSPTYSREILTPGFGYRMDGVLRARQHDLFGILNGVDYGQWNPGTDRFIPHQYTEETLDMKESNKITLNKIFDLDAGDAPVIGMITRLAQQKGIDLLLGSINRILSMGYKVVLLGSGDKVYEERAREIAGLHKGRMSVKLGFDNSLAHLIEAGADIFLMPSVYEPCGLNQMYSLKYGTVPAVSATGGLNDTVIEYDPSAEQGNGFKFEPQNAEDMLTALKKALDVYNDRQRWQRLVRAGMASDFSWGRSAGDYELLYKAYQIKSYLHGDRDASGSTHP